MTDKNRVDENSINKTFSLCRRVDFFSLRLNRIPFTMCEPFLIVIESFVIAFE